MRLDVLLGQDRVAGGDATDQRQTDLVTQRVLELNTTGGARNELDDPLAL